MLFMPLGGTPTPSETIGIDVAYLDDVECQFGTGLDVQIRWDTGQTNDSLLWGVSGSNSVIMCEVADMGTDFAIGNQTNPTLFVHSADATVVADYISITHNQTDGVITMGAGGLSIAPAATSGTPGTTGSLFRVNTATFTDSATAEAGTAAAFTGYAFAAPTLAATNLTVTTTAAATVYISGPVIAGTNETLAATYALWIASGNARFDGAVMGTTGSATVPVFCPLTDATDGVGGAAGTVALITNSLSRLTASDTALTATVPFLSGSGNGTNPVYSFSSTATTGIYNSNTNEIGFTCNGGLTVTINPTQVGITTGIKLTERAAVPAAPGAGFGSLWVRNDTPSVLVFTDDAGADHVVAFVV